MADKLKESVAKSLKVLVDHCDDEDREVRDRQVRTWKKLKYYWDGWQRLYYSETAHDWRVPDFTGDEYSSYYDKPVNVFRSYLESIIAALSVTVPPIKCYPDDADNTLDVATARAGDKISLLVSRHNNAELLWIHALYILCTEGMVASYRYTKEDEKYGTYEEEVTENRSEEVDINTCPVCNTKLVDDNVCPECIEEVKFPLPAKETIEKTVITGKIKKPKARQCIEVYGGLYVKISNYAKKQEDCLYLMWNYETHYANVRSRYPDIQIHEGKPAGANEYYERWGRTSTQYSGEEPENIVSCRNVWVRPALFHILDKDDREELEKLYAKGVKVVLADDKICEAVEEDLDDHWTLTANPLSDHLHHEPNGLLLVNVQDMTNDLLALVLQTIEHGIPQTFADPSVLDFKEYKNTEATPGAIFPARPKAGKTVRDAFYEVRTATLSREIEPFMQRVQEIGQLVSGALPSLFGGVGGKTAAEYSMSRAQAQQRLQSSWKMLRVWWKDTFGKVIPAYISDVMEDERLVEEDEQGNFVNIVIRKAELEGKIGRVELDTSEQLPITHAQKKDAIMELIKMGNEQILAAFTSPENVGLLSEAIGLDDFTLPNQDDIEKQYEEIQQLLQSGPMPSPDGIELPSVQPDMEVDNHEVAVVTIKKWAVSAAGRAAKRDNPNGYKNVLLKLKMHMMALQPPPMLPEQVPNQQPSQVPRQQVNQEGVNGLNEQFPASIGIQ
jgi:hypothetical protein